jgi:ppGpp synthetase/RelA/SpoT-type nucleotidyltranferase
VDLESFRNELIDMRPGLEAWGDFVSAKLKGSGIPVQLLQCRVKEIESAIGKIGRKGYRNPMTEMTDLVGVRVVVLLTPELDRIRDWVFEQEEWTATISRDPDLEMAQRPEKFDYQSIHFELRAAKDLDFNGQTVAKSMCCEFQARTLMQHAYAEVVHDNIYKSSWPAPTKAKRFVASSAALISTADHLFCETMELLEAENRERGQLLECLTNLYERLIQSDAASRDKKFNMVVLDASSSYQDGDVCTSVASLLDQKKFIVPKIQGRLNDDPFWGQPVALLAYWLVTNWPDEAFKLWPFASSHEALQLVYSDLGLNP